jgi:putative oxidoreductase
MLLSSSSGSPGVGAVMCRPERRHRWRMTMTTVVSHGEREVSALSNVGLLLMRFVVGGLMMGHGSQKLFGWFGGYGLKGTGGFMESLGLRPGRRWAALAGWSEFVSGLLTALGMLHPLGPILLFGPMSTATRKVHWGKPIWVTEGGAELPVTNMAVATALAMVGPGKFSIDRIFRIRLPWPVVALFIWGTILGVLAADTTSRAPSEETEEAAGAELQGGEGAATTAMSG